MPEQLPYLRSRLAAGMHALTADFFMSDKRFMHLGGGREGIKEKERNRL
jgi:hypothetical protein